MIWWRVYVEVKYVGFNPPYYDWKKSIKNKKIGKHWFRCNGLVKFSDFPDYDVD